MGTIKESSLPNLIYRGKVRDTHDLGDEKYLMVATDRISVFDVVILKRKNTLTSRLYQNSNNDTMLKIFYNF